MIRNDCSPETAHVVNWFLYSPDSNLVELIREAWKRAEQRYVEKNVESQLERDVDPDDMDAVRIEWKTEIACEELAEILEDHFETLVPFQSHFLPFNEWSFYGLGVDDYKHEYYGEAPESLFIPLLGNVFRNINFNDAAKLILEHAPAVKMTS